MLVRWYDIDREMAALDAAARQLDRMFGELWSSTPTRLTAGWPRASLADEGDRLVAFLEVPGLDKDTLSVEVLGDTLTVSGERKVTPPEGYRVHRAERTPRQGKFTRSFGLPCRVDPEKTSANLKDGVLTITMEKHADSRPRQITVSTS